MHPNKASSVKGNNAKLKRMTEDYGAADPSMFKTAKGVLKNGPQDDVGFGEGDKPAPRGDKARRTSAANPIATYAKGGRVRHAGGGVIGGQVAMRAMGGRLEGEMGMPSNVGSSKGRGKRAGTNVNIIVAPQSGPPPGPAAAPQLPPPMPGGPGGPGAGAGGPPGLPPGLPMPPGAAPAGALPPGLPQLPRKRGGRVHPDATEDKALVKQMVKPTALRARGGSIKMTAGAESGPGRLEKSAARARRQSDDKNAEV